MRLSCFLTFYFLLLIFLSRFSNSLESEKTSSPQFVIIEKTGERVKLPPVLHPKKKVNQDLPKTFPPWFRTQVLMEKEKKEEVKKPILKKKKISKNLLRPKPKKKKKKKQEAMVKLDFSNLRKDHFLRLKKNSSRLVLLKNYIVQKKIKNLGFILSKKSGSERANFLFPNEEVIVKIKGAKFINLGDRFRIYRSTKERLILSPYYTIEILGVIRITKSLTKHHFEATIEKLFSTATVGDKITNEPLMKIAFESHGSIESLKRKAKIFNSKRNLNLFIQTQSIVFLNRGFKHGVREGQKLAIHENLSLRGEYDLRKKGAFIGILRIVHVQEKFSTAIVVAARKIIYAGDNVGMKADEKVIFRKSASQRAIDRFNYLESERGEEEALLNEKIIDENQETESLEEMFENDDEIESD